MTRRNPDILLVRFGSRMCRLGCAALVLLIVTGNCSSQVLPFHRYTIREGAISNAVNAEIQDSRGYIWIGTTDGLSRYDGAAFKNYSPENGMSFSHVNNLIESRKSPGAIYAGTNGGGVNVIRDDKVTVLRVGSSVWSNRVNCLLEDSSGTIWCGTDAGVFLIRDGRVVPFRDGLEPQGLGCLSEPNDSLIWLSGANALFVYHVRNDSLEKFPPPYPHWQGIQCMFVDRKRDLWLGTPDSMLLEIHGTTVVRQIRVPCGSLSAIEEDENGEMWCGSAVGIITIQNPVSADPVFTRYTTANGLPDNSVSCVLLDKEGDLWFGGFNKGLFKLSERSVEEFPHDIPFDAGNDDMAALDHRGHFWIARGDSLSEFWKESGGRWRENTRQLAIGGLDFRAFSIHFDLEGNIWIRGEPTGFACFQLGAPAPGGTPLKLLRTLKSGRDYPSGAICFVVDARDQLWMGMPSVGVAHLDLSRPVPLIKLYRSPGEISDLGIRALFEDSRGRIWCGGYIGGAIVIDPRTDSVMTLTAAGGLPDNSVRTFAEDKTGDIWIGTRYGGIGVYHNGVVRTIAQAQGLLTTAVSSLNVDPLGNIWIATTAGVQYMPPPFGKLKSNNEITGLHAYTCLPASDGSEFIVAAEGYILYNPGDDRQNLTPPPVYIAQFVVNEKEMQTGVHAALSHDQNNCRIGYVGVTMRGEQGIRYRYMLEGLDEFWQTPTVAKSITYAALKPGNYRFLVKAINADGVESTAPAVLSFAISAPYWMQWWFVALCAALFVAFGLLALRIRERRLVEIERIRARIAADLHDDIGSGLVRIALLSDVIRRQAATAERAGPGRPNAALSAGGYSIAASTDRVGTIARELVDAMSDVVWAIDPRHDAFDLLARRIETLATEVCEAKGIRLRFVAQPGGNDLKPGSTSIRTILLVLKESLTNIVRHARCSSVEITLGYFRSPDRLRIVVHDDGVGFDPARLPRVNGLENMKTRSAKAGGTFRIVSAIGSGTHIEAEIPMSS